MENGSPVDATPLGQLAVAIIGLVGSFCVGLFAAGRTSGKKQGQMDERLIGQSADVRDLQSRMSRSETSVSLVLAQKEINAERLTRLEARYEVLDGRISMVAARVADLPTRAEMSQRFDRIEMRLDGVREKI